ncbi:MAG: hypothetical protein AAF850_03185 [Pseudomonadota bacterium]
MSLKTIKWTALKRKRKDKDPARETPEDGPTINVEAGLSRVLQTRSLPPADNSKQVSRSAVRGALTAIESALFAVDQVRDIIEQAYEVTLSARDVADIAGRALLAERYDELRLSIDETVKNAEPAAAQLIGFEQSHIEVTIAGSAAYSITPTRLDASASGLKLSPPRDAFETFEEIEKTLAELDAAMKRTDRAAAGYCRDAQFLITKLPNSQVA